VSGQHDGPGDGLTPGSATTTSSALRYGAPKVSISPARAAEVSTPITTTKATETVTATAAAT
jgi:hypothetical protein